jgi:hypothetical protein
MVDGMIDFFKRLLGVKSPSLEFTETFGEAVKNEAGDYARYMQDIAEAMTVATQEAADSIGGDQ